jgi:hypothetical protein
MSNELLKKSMKNPSCTLNLKTAFRILAALTIAFAAFSSRSYADTLDVQFGCTTYPTTSCAVNTAGSITNTLAQIGPAVIGSGGDIWNLVSPATSPFNSSGSASALRNTSGTATTDSVSWTTTGEFTRGLPQDPVAFDSTPYENLMSGYLFESGTGTITIGGLVAGEEYALYLYTQGDVNATGRRTTFTVNGGSPFTTSPGSNSTNTFISGQNYVLFDVAANASGNISVVYSKNAGEADVNGFQLTAVPEPSTVIPLLTLLAVAFLARKRFARGNT